MRYVIEFLIPALIVIVVSVVLFRNRAAATASQGGEDTGTLSTGTFVAILIIGATFTVALIYALHNSTS